MLRNCLFILITTIAFLIFPKVIYAENFLVDADVTYTLNEEGEVNVVHDIRLQNLKTEFFAKEFTFSLSGVEIENAQAYDSNGELETLVEQKEESTGITINFSDNLVGKDKYRNFSVSFVDTSLLTKTGGVWEVNVPKLLSPESFESYDVRFIIPKSMGEIAYIAPSPNSQNDIGENVIYYFRKEDLTEAGVMAALGEYQSFSFNLSYHLENPLLKSTEVEIALPPDTPYQQLYYESITPRPDNIRVTEEGNWLASYKLASRERLDITAVGYVKIFAEARYQQNFDQLLSKNLQATEYWQVNDPEIKELANELKTPENIYNYVVSSLKYNYDNVSPTTKRLGAKKALIQANQAICTEFTDLFIALSRAAGIPAREINGFAATENPSLQPLSLVADVLHAWPEYWDFERQVWVPVDPTWGHTTGGADYFSKLDLRHFAFVIHGLSATEPPPPGSYKLGSNPQKDVYVSFSQIPEFEVNPLNIDVNQQTRSIFGTKIVVDIQNPGPTAIYDKKIQIMYDNQSEIEKDIDVLLPFNEQRIEFVIPYGILGSKMPENVTINIGDYSHRITTNKQNKVTRDIAILTTIVIMIFGSAVIIYLYKKRKK